MAYLRRVLVLWLSFLAACGASCSGAGSSSGSSDPAHPAGPRVAQLGPASAGTAPSEGATPADPRELELGLAVGKLLEAEHLRHPTVDDSLSEKAFKRYIKAIDPGKMFLVQSDVDKLRIYADKIDDELHSGRLQLAHAGSEVFARRVGAVKVMIADILAHPLNLTDQEWIETDPDKLAVARSDQELRDRWRRRLELEVLERMAVMDDRAADLAKDAKKGTPGAAGGKHKAAPHPAVEPGSASVPSPGPNPDTDTEADADGTPPLSADQIPPTESGREAKAQADLAKSYDARLTRLLHPGKLDAASDLLNAVTSSLDPHTDYLPPDDEANFDIQMSGSLEGIGAVLREDDHYIRVVQLVPGGASWRQGQLEAGDVIEAVAQQGKQSVDVADMRIDDVVRMIRGKKGTIVTLTVRKPAGQEQTIAITRDVVVIEAAYARGAVLKLKGDRSTYGYIYLPSFYGGQTTGARRSAAGDVRRLLSEMRKRKVSGVVLDIRQNGGGLLDDAVKMTGLLIDHGPVVQTRTSDGKREVLRDRDPGETYDGKLVVLVDRYSASASEILAAALQDYKRAVIVGTGPTHGKGTVQVLADLDRMVGSHGPSLGVLKLTIEQFFRVNGASTQWKGVVPDIVLPDPDGYKKTRERQLDNSIPWSSIDPVAHTDWPTHRNLSKLKAESARRVAKSDVFAHVTAQTKLLLAQRDDTKLPLARPVWTALRKQREAQIDGVSPKINKGPARFTVTIVDYDGKARVLARPGGKVDDTYNKWRENLSRDPWVEESLHVLHDMVRGG